MDLFRGRIEELLLQLADHAAALASIDRCLPSYRAAWVFGIRYKVQRLGLRNLPEALRSIYDDQGLFRPPPTASPKPANRPLDGTDGGRPAPPRGRVERSRLAQ